MAQIRPDEVSSIIREQLSNYKTAAQLEEVGTVLQVGDGIARIYGLTKVKSGELIEFDNGLKGIVLNLEEDNVGAVLLGSSAGVKEGDTVKRTNQIASIQVGHGMLGRVVKTLGQKRFRVYCNDNVERTCRLAGSVRKSQWVAEGSVVVVDT